MHFWDASRLMFVKTPTFTLSAYNVRIHLEYSPAPNRKVILQDHVTCRLLLFPLLLSDLQPRFGVTSFGQSQYDSTFHLAYRLR
jgi:hypothetical protein